MNKTKARAFCQMQKLRSMTGQKEPMRLKKIVWGSAVYLDERNLSYKLIGYNTKAFISILSSRRIKQKNGVQT